MRTPGSANATRRLLPLALALLALPRILSAQTTVVTPVIAPLSAAAIPLMLPSGLVTDAVGNLFFAETGAHLLRRVSAAGVLTTIAGTGTQGFAGDNGSALAALLDSPTAVALDAASHLVFSDSHNHRIRQIDLASGIITTLAGTGTPGRSPDGTPALAAHLGLPSALAFDLAGNLFFADASTHLVRRIDHASGRLVTIAGDGTQGFSGDGGPALAAAIDSPAGLALDAAGDLFLADTHNHRVRRVDHLTGTITTLAGSGLPAFSGDSAAARNASLHLPRGLAIDSAGNLFLADSSNHRIRRIDAVTGLITTFAGDGTQSFRGDFEAATAASLNSPSALALAPSGMLLVADAANGRVRQIDSSALISTLAGLRVLLPGSLLLSSPARVTYGSGSVLATLQTSPASGPVLFFETIAGQPHPLASIPLASNLASISTSSLPAGTHLLTATFSGDRTHAAAQSATFALVIAPAPVAATPEPVSLLFGQPIPPLSGAVTGILPQDTAAVAVSFSSLASAFSPPALYPITAALSGAAAGNYAVISAPAAVVIAKAPSSVTLSATLAVHALSSTAGVPSGSVTLLDGTTAVLSLPLSATGDASFPPSALSLGTHTLTAAYAGNVDFLASSSAPTIAAIGPITPADFTLSSTGQTTASVPAGTSAAFAFAVGPLNGSLSSPILLAASGLPPGATPSFSPAYLPPGGAVTAFTLTIQTQKTAVLVTPRKPSSPERTSPILFAALFPVFALFRKRARQFFRTHPRSGVTALVCLCLAPLLTGCGTRILSTGDAGPTSRSYNITVNATATAASGATLQHTAAVVLVLQ